MKSNPSELEAIEEKLKEEQDRRMYERYQTIRLYMKGYPVSEITEITNCSEKTIRTYIKCYKDHGLNGLTMGVSSGKPPRLSKEQREQLKQTIIHSLPHEVGFPTKFNWTLEIIAAYIKQEFGKTYSLRGVSKMLERMDLSYTKPTYTLA